ncbi:MAG: hypothetical protein K1X85_11475 [Ignavibacteria bacterium]|nr:hypothetical protein [Ignavibacteria bacterium]
MKTTITFLGIMLLILSGFDADAQNIFRSRTSGNWNSPSTWEVSTNNGSTWSISVSSYPTADSAGSVNVRSPHTVTVPAGVTIPADQLTIDNGSTVSLSSASFLEIRQGSGDDITMNSGTVSGSGTLRLNGSGISFVKNSGSVVSCALKVSADAVVYCANFPNIADFAGNVTVDAGAVFSTNPGGFTTQFLSNVTNNGTIATGNSSGNNDFRGASLVNNGSISSYNVSFSDTVTVTGSGTWSVVSMNINSGAMFKLGSDITIGTASSTTLTVAGSGSLNPNSRVFRVDGTTGPKVLRINGGGRSENSGSMETLGDVTLDLMSASTFSTRLRIVSGVTNGYCSNFPNVAIFGENVTIDPSAELKVLAGGYTLRFTDSVACAGTMSTGNSSGSIELYGLSLTNSGLISSHSVYINDTVNVFGSGSWSSANVYITNGGLMKLQSNITFATSSTSLLQVNSGGKIDMNSLILTLDGTSGPKTFKMNDGSLSGSLGNLNTLGSVTVDLLNTSSFNTRLKAVSGVTSVYSSNFPNVANFYNEIIVDAPATLNVIAGGYQLLAHSNLVNNGIISTGNSSGRLILSGPAFTNNGTISAYNLSLDGNLNSVGTGIITSGSSEITAGSTLNLEDDLKIVANFGISFTARSNSTLNLNGKILKLDGTGGSCTFQQINGSEVTDSGIVETYGNITLDIYSSAFFNAPLNAKSGTTSIYSSQFPNVTALTNKLTVDTATVFQIVAGGYTLYTYNDVFNSGTISTGNSSGTVRHFGDSVVNNGTVSAYNFYFESVPADMSQIRYLTGVGKFTSPNLQILNGTYVQLSSTHSLAYLQIENGATFDITSKQLRLIGGGTPMAVNGAIITGGSTIEYAGTSPQSTVHTNMNYANMTISNASGVTVAQNFSIPGLLRINLGKLDLNGKIITFLTGASLLESSGNVITGTSGYLTTTRQISAPSNLNVAGFGVSLTSSANLGLTEIRRGHSVQTIPGGQSVKRYYVIRPENNSGLNATAVFRYDDTELNGNVEANLKMLKSTDAGATYLTGGGTVNTSQNTVTVTAMNDFARHTLGPGVAIASITLSPEGLYNSSVQRMNMRDTVRIQLRNSGSPYAVVDSAKGVVDSVTLTVQVLFPNATNGNYYVAVKHRNSIETWSATPQVYNVGSSLVYNFTSAQSQAFGDNMRLKGTRWVIFSGDVNQDGAVDATDVQAVDNDAGNFVSGYVSTDLNGDGFVDGSDFTIGDNNAFNFVSKIVP